MSNVREFSRRCCSYKGCVPDALQIGKGPISLFSFPVKDTERCSAWITNSGREEFRYLNPKELAEKRICELHFHESMFSNFFKSNLKKHAIPQKRESNKSELMQTDSEKSSNGSVVVKEDLSGGVSSMKRYLDDVANHTENIQTSTKGSILSAALINGTSSAVRDSQVSVLEPPLKTESTPAQEQSSAISTSNVKPVVLIKVLKSNTNKTKNTKFHNLPPETTHNEFYFQQCPDPLDDTNTSSLPEPPDGELPLFVQQNSVVSLADEPEQANSDFSEPVAKRRRRDRDNGDMKDMFRQLKSVTNLLTSCEDEFELFGKSVAVQLKKMNLCTAVAVQAKIQNLLSEYRINDIRRGVLQNEGINKTSEEKPEEKQNLEPLISPQLSLTCDSGNSDNENAENK